ncbi:putative quinol monooxygenase [Rhodococcoides kroppenstedtii]|uniref:putative quinol monooxygenase n=1 Tax=Rhodococcoides kroppenstedtii TaxID=293050 RepID=UPI001BDF39CE|nr:antibiotic biosynthesis monooxygenase family protein [Rhodococcus kroppenstedtii]MBT1192843.1 antibiotic biosynthesis monooxygenase [Rhodococcus kroppenstedtii]
MAVTALLDLSLDPERLPEAHRVLAETLVATRGFDGCLDVKVTADVDDPAHVVVVETWESREHDAAYRAFRASPEGRSELGTVLVAAPTLTVLEHLDI